MALSADTLIDRLYLKSQITRWRLLAIVAIVVALIAFFERGSGHSPIEPDFIARVSIEGVMLDDAKVEKMLREIEENGKARALLVRMDTPGGSAVAGQQMYEQFKRISKVKPVVVTMRDLSASAGYLASMGADRIFAMDGTLTGSIGVIIQSTEFTELAKKIGVNPITIKTGPYKDALSPLTEENEAHKAVMQSVVDDFYSIFVDIIAKNRKLPRSKVIELADGRVYTGRQALSHKLIDAIGSENDAIAWLEKEKKITKGLNVKDIKPKRDEIPFLDQVTNTVMQKIVPTSTGKLDGLVAIWHPNLQIQ